tara:strand:+ start:96120 stop:96449 length:330 start_codon:yes stop_codon:yes gene_type:complete
MENTTGNDGKTIGIIAYLTIIGFVIAIIMNNTQRNEYASFHIRQMLGLILLSIAISVLSLMIDLGVVGTILSFFVLILWVLGFVGAIQGEMKLVPVLGEQFQDWFSGVK